jgi:hypothetical protein
MSVRVHVLAQQGHFPHAPPDKSLDFTDDLIQGTASFAPAAVRDNTIGTKVVAEGRKRIQEL